MAHILWVDCGYRAKQFSYKLKVQRLISSVMVAAITRSADHPCDTDEEIVLQYDGDMVSDRAPFTVEANEECEQILNSVSHYITAQGKLIRSLGNEAFLTLFNMTNDAPAGGMASDEIKYELLHTKYEDFGCRKITHWFGATADHKTKKINPPRYNHRDKVHLKAGECCNKTDVTTTCFIPVPILT